MASSATALIVVDMQEDFCPPNGTCPTPDGRSILPIVNHLLTLPFDVKVGTQDWHPSDHISFVSQHAPPNNVALSWTTHSNPDDPTQTRPLLLCPPHCIQDTSGAALLPDLNASALELMVHKGQDSQTEMFSGFSDAFGWRVRDGKAVADVDLGEYLEQRGVGEVYVCGLTGDCCVRSTALDAVRLGFRTWVVEDAQRSGEEMEEGMGMPGWRRSREELVKAGVGIVSAEEVEKRVGA